ncbi:hypothetical protein N9Q68_01465 [Polaribacter sp.]|nr:hypothetical protein [Polaribacter sp.]
MNNILIEVVENIDKIIRSNEWFDFHVLNYDGRTLKIGGGINLTYYHSLEILFTDVFFVHGFFQTWHSETKDQVLLIPDEELNQELNIKFEIEKGYQIYIFRTEDYKNDVYIAAKQITFNENIQRYYEGKNK